MTCSEKEEDMTQDLPDPAPIPVVSGAFLSCYLNHIPNLFIPCIVLYCILKMQAVRNVQYCYVFSVYTL
jgi:hypothetical protein